MSKCVQAGKITSEGFPVSYKKARVVKKSHLERKESRCGMEGREGKSYPSWNWILFLVRGNAGMHSSYREGDL